MRYLALAAALLLPSGAAFAEVATARIHVTGLTCSSCDYIGATALKRVETVEIAEFVEGEADDGIYVLRYDDAVTQPEALIAAVTGVGYGATLTAGSDS